MFFPKGFFLIFSLVFFLPFSALSESNFSLYTQPHFGLTRGHLHEEYFDNFESHRLLSQLVWDRNFFTYGAKIGTSYKRFHADFDFTAGIPSKSGLMTDSDFMNDSQPEMKTSFSTGDNQLYHSYDFDLSFSFDFYPFSSPENKLFILSPLIGLQYQYDSFERDGGEGWYGEYNQSSDHKHHWWYDEEAKHYPHTYWNSEKNRYVTQKLGGITYRRHTFYTWTGFSFLCNVNSHLSVNFSAALSPFTFYSATDIHYPSATEYFGQQFVYFKALKFALASSYSFTKHIAINLNSSITVFPETKGDYYKNDKYDSYSQTASSLFIFNVSSGIKVSL